MYSLIAIDIQAHKNVKARNHPDTMDDEAGLGNFSFSDQGFKFSVDRAKDFATSVNTRRFVSNGHATTIFTKSFIKIDNTTKMPFIVIVERVNNASVDLAKKSRVIGYRPVWNETDLMDQLHAMGCEDKITEINTMKLTYQDQELRNNALRMKSRGVVAVA